MSSITESLANAQYISLMTHRKDGTGVATPVWVARRGDFLYVWTQAESGKAKRIARDPIVQVAACTVSGKLKGAYVEATARILDAEGEELVRELMLAKYGWKLRSLIWQQKVRKKVVEHIGVEISLSAEITRPEDAQVVEQA